jgi:membrane-associated phospholipid phosphatase
MKVWVVLTLCLLPRLAVCQPLPMDRWTPPFPTETQRKIADAASWVTVLTTVALDTRESWNGHCSEMPFSKASPIGDPTPRVRCFLMQGTRLGITYGAVFLIKKLVHRDRPCAPDCGGDRPEFSFYSGHTALAFSTLGGPRLAFSLPLAIGTGGLRIGAGKHYLTDVLAAAAIGFATSRIR